MVVTTSRPGPAAYVPMKAGGSAFALIGALAEIAEGKELAKKYSLRDPAPDIAVEIAKAFAASKGAAVAAPPIVVTEENPAAIIAGANGANYVVDVAGGGVTSMYFSFDWTHYGVMYGATLRILDVATGDILMKGRCFIKPKKSPDSPTNAEMMADDAKVLKAMIAAAGEACITELKAKVLKL